MALAKHLSSTHQPRRRIQRPAGRNPASCAVIGSGGVLRYSELGTIIDRHESVIRFNGAPTLGLYSKDVGSRTTLQLSTLVPWRHWRRRVDAAQLATTRDNALYCHNSWLGNCWLDALKSGNSSHIVNPVLVAHASALLREHRRLGRGSRRASQKLRVPSSGVVGVAIALATCRGVPHVFGFGNLSRDEALCDHYWECRTDQRSYLKRPTHDFAAQWRLLEWLDAVGAIKLHATPPTREQFRLPPGRQRMNV